MRCPKEHYVNECLTLQCELFANHAGDCAVSHDGVVWYVAHSGMLRLPVDAFGRPLEQKIIGCVPTEIQLKGA